MYENKPEVVEMVNNRTTFLANISPFTNCLDYTTSLTEATTWLMSGQPVIAHADLYSRRGANTYYLDTVGSLKDYNTKAFKLFTKYMPRQDEFRICLLDDMVSMTFIRTKPGKARYNKTPTIRSVGHGYEWNVADKPAPDAVIDQAYKALQACGLRFGVFDIMWNSFRETATVMDGHTCVKLSGSMDTRYEEGFDQIINPDKPKKRRSGIGWDQIAGQEPGYFVVDNNF